MICEVRVLVPIEYETELPIENFLTKDSVGFDCLTDEGVEKIVEPIVNNFCDIFGGCDLMMIAPKGENPIYEV